MIKTSREHGNVNMLRGIFKGVSDAAAAVKVEQFSGLLLQEIWHSSECSITAVRIPCVVDIYECSNGYARLVLPFFMLLFRSSYGNEASFELRLI